MGVTAVFEGIAQPVGEQTLATLFIILLLAGAVVGAGLIMGRRRTAAASAEPLLRPRRATAGAPRPLPASAPSHAHASGPEAGRDALTGLPDRTRFAEELAAAIGGAGAEQRIAVLLADLDGFRTLNADHGETVGDSLLLQAARRIRTVTREEDLAARVDGDQFGLIQYGGTEPAHAFRLAGRIQSALAKPVRAGPAQLRLGCSIGIAFYPDDGSDPAELVRKAGQALAYARAGGGTVQAYEARMDQAVQQRRQLAADLRHALAKGQFSLHFQPVTGIADGHIIGFEALCRWRNPRLGPISPAILVPLAEEMGAMPALGEWVLRRACAEAALWAVPTTISASVSPVQLADPDFPATVAAILAETGLAPARLDLEITETVLTGDNAAALAALQRLRALGVSVSLGRFGTGAGSLTALRLLPFDRLKLDPCLTRDIAASAEARAIARAVILMAKGLGMIVVAEEVETEAQLQALRGDGCDLVQGEVPATGANAGFLLAPAGNKASGREQEAV